MVERLMSAEGPSLSNLLNDLLTQIAQLIRRELALARVEIAETSKALAASAVTLAVAAVLSIAMLATATACAILALANAVPPWTAAGIVTAICACVAAALAALGVRRMRRALSTIAPVSTQTLKDDIAWAKTHRRSNAK